MFNNGARERRPFKRGFTLLEIMAVVVIMGLLVGAVAVAVRGNVSKAKIERAKFDLGKIDNALVSYEMANNGLPTEEEGLKVLLGDKEKGIPKSLEKLSKDPWGNPYEYRRQDDPEQPYLLICYGSDGLPGGEGAAKDLTHLDIEN